MMPPNFIVLTHLDLTQPDPFRWLNYQRVME